MLGEMPNSVNVVKPEREPMRPMFVTVLGRTLGVLSGLLMVGIVIRLFDAVLRPVLPDFLMNGLDAGWASLIDILCPALGPILTVPILAGLCWIVVSRRQ